MPNIVHVTYDQTGKSKSTNALGLREMHEFNFETCFCVFYQFLVTL